MMDPNNSSSKGEGDLKLAAEARQLRTDVKELAASFVASQRTVNTLRRLTLLICALLAVTLVGGISAAVVLARQNNRITNYLNDGREFRAAISRIDDCINPAGACYARSQKNTGELLERIIDTNHNGKADTQEILDALERLAR
jgi:hypothetical protein